MQPPTGSLAFTGDEKLQKMGINDNTLTKKKQIRHRKMHYSICNMRIYPFSGVYVHRLICNSACQCLILETIGGDRSPRQPGMRGHQIAGLLVTFWGYCFHSS